MNWLVYQLLFRLEAPLHIGRRGWGIIQRTRPYVMGKNMWAAVTAQLTRQLARDTFEDYQTVGNALKESAVFTYLYPTMDPDTVGPLLPHYMPGAGLCYGNLSESEFEYRFCGSYASTAMDPVSQSAEDASLHEIEVLLARTRDGGHQVQLFGYLLLQASFSVFGDTIDAQDVFGLLTEIQVGGERGYGYGKLCLLKHRQLQQGELLFGRYPIVLSGADAPAVEIKSGEPFPAHVRIDPQWNAWGDIEPLTGREWGTFGSREGAGQVMLQGQNVPVCYVPGSARKFDSDQAIKYALDLECYGILQAC